MNASLKALLNEQYKLVAELREENKKLREEKEFFYKSAKQFREENENLKAIIDHYKKFEEGKNKLEGMLMEED